MNVQEKKVLLSPDGLGRVAIVKRHDGLFCLYSRWQFSIETQRSLGIEAPYIFEWSTDHDPELYYDSHLQIEAKPVSGIFGTLDDAEKEARRILGLSGS